MASASKVISFVVPSQQKQSNEPPSGPENSEEKYTLEQAFNELYLPGKFDSGSGYSELNVERAIRAVAFLLHWACDHGNEEIDGFMVHGLAGVLDRIASDTMNTFKAKNREIERVKGRE